MDLICGWCTMYVSQHFQKKRYFFVLPFWFIGTLEFGQRSNPTFYESTFCHPAIFVPNSRQTCVQTNIYTESNIAIIRKFSKGPWDHGNRDHRQTSCLRYKLKSKSNRLYALRKCQDSSQEYSQVRMFTQIVCWDTDRNSFVQVLGFHSLLETIFYSICSVAG